MKQMFSFIGLFAMLAILSTGCSEVNGPTTPAAIATIDFPAEGNGGQEQGAKPTAPHGLKAVKNGAKVNLIWQHTSMGSSLYRLYRAQDLSGFSLIQTLVGLEFEDSPVIGYSKLKYRVTAINAQGIESPFSGIFTVYGGKGSPNEQIGQDDLDDLN